jgi:hypothetical protein
LIWLACRLSYDLAANSEPLHHCDEGCPSQSESGSSAKSSADNPIGGAERLRDMRTLEVLKCPGREKLDLLSAKFRHLQF